MSIRSELGRFGIVTVAAMKAINGHRDGTPSVLALYVALCTHADRHEDEAWRCSRGSIAEEAGVSESTVKKAKKVLQDLGLIKVTENFTSDGDRGWDSYLVMFTPGGSPDDRGGSESGRGGSPDARYSSDQVTDQVTDQVIASQAPLAAVEGADEATARALCELLADGIVADGGRRPTVTKAWVTAMERLVRIDERSPEEVEKVIGWLIAERDSTARFWRPNIRSPRKLREKWDQMAAQYKRDQKQSPAGSNPYLNLLKEDH